MAEIGRHSRRPHDVVERQLRDEGALLQKQRQWLTDAPGSSQHSHLGGTLRREREREGSQHRRDSERDVPYQSSRQ